MEVAKKPILFWIITGIIVAFVITFSILNRQSVDINFLFIRLSGRLFFVLIVFFLLGFFLGKISHLRKKYKNKNKKKNEEYVTYIED